MELRGLLFGGQAGNMPTYDEMFARAVVNGDRGVVRAYDAMLFGPVVQLIEFVLGEVTANHRQGVVKEERNRYGALVVGAEVGQPPEYFHCRQRGAVLVD